MQEEILRDRLRWIARFDQLAAGCEAGDKAAIKEAVVFLGKLVLEGPDPHQLAVMLRGLRDNLQGYQGEIDAEKKREK